MSYKPCNFRPFSLPDYEPLPPGVELSLPKKARVPNPFLFQRGTAQFAPSTTSWPINMPKVQPNPPTKMSFATIQYPWAQFDQRWQAPCNVWSMGDADPKPDGYQDFGATGAVEAFPWLKAVAVVAVAAISLHALNRSGGTPGEKKRQITEVVRPKRDALAELKSRDPYGVRKAELEVELAQTPDLFVRDALGQEILRDMRLEKERKRSNEARLARLERKRLRGLAMAPKKKQA